MSGSPIRVQLSRRKGWRMPFNTVKVDRATGYGNPFVVGEWPGQAFADYMAGDPTVRDAEHAVALYRKLLIKHAAKSDDTVDALLKLRGKNLACWCRLDQPCHADVLLELANREVAA
ncbi:DUF4326 domain-containing protein [Kaistia nematophila]|uniref:DUF4326 domain-containing protein n=1 Tax=Kaistia nematophila TaxID=2994654 RepID=A0A9X3ILK7_9HYPH|nr:DUF4326 domain-containing protein [Kaistia nematophila]MCX5569646.1 DUF4326 domain-containing protein [Kaistia nematophila]